MSLDQLLHEVSVHYRSRGFPESALNHLRWALLTSTRDDVIDLVTATASYRRSVADLVGHFKNCPDPPEARISEASAVFGFAFGYRMEAWTDGRQPTEESEVVAHRRPGKNNEALAETAVWLQQQYNHLLLFLQFEISDAVAGRASVACTSSRKDRGTYAVAHEFISHAHAQNVSIQKVVLLAHQHHYERCRIILQQQGITCLPAGKPYSGYDDYEAQPRVMSPEEYIVSDFVSMAAMKPTA